MYLAMSESFKKACIVIKDVARVHTQNISKFLSNQGHGL